MSDISLDSLVNVLGIERKAGDYSLLDLAERLNEGLPLKSLEHARRHIAPDYKGFNRLVVPDGTLKRRRQQHQPLNAQESQRLERIARIWVLAMDVYKDPKKARRFMTTPHQMLRGKLPFEVAAANDVGAEIVENILGRLKYGSAA